MAEAGGGEPQDDLGAGATSPIGIPARGWWAILWRVYARADANDVPLVAAGVTFYALLALFPALAAFVSLYGLFLDPATIPAVAGALHGVLPNDAIAFLRGQLHALADQETGALTFGFLVSLGAAIWSANSATKSVIEALNIAYGEEERRGYVRLTLVSLAFTLGAMAVVSLVIAAFAVLPAAFAAARLEREGAWILRMMRWPVVLAATAAGLAALYRYGPSRQEAEWRWVSWGGALATLVWLAASLAFTFYLERFADYNATYGSLGALVGLLLWIWISMLIVLVGGELNGEMERQSEGEPAAPPQGASR